MRSARPSLFRFLILGGLLGATALGAFGCQSVAGIEERKFDSTSADAPTAQCLEYCDTVEANCTGDRKVYKTRQICLDVCANLDPGDSEGGGNTVACRLAEAQTAAREPDSCASAGPGGNGRCGSDCEAWCGLLETSCPDDFAALDGDCLGRCAGLSDTSEFDAETFYTGDTLQCRLIHVGAALTVPEAHCSHAAFIATQQCIPGPTEEPTCEKLCQVTQAVCTDDLAQWESEEQCLAACAVLDLGEAADISENSVGCRIYHAITAGGSAPGAATTHCQHAGPTGDGHCGHLEDGDGTCQSYCTLLEGACADDPGYPFANRDACEAACETDLADKGAADDSKYSVTDAESGDTLQCRTLHAARAFGDATQCAAALGGAPCN